MQKVTASQDWKNRMNAAKKKLPEGIGQQDVIKELTVLAPHLDTLTNATRWRNAWFMKSADPEFTKLVELIVKSLEKKDVHPEDDDLIYVDDQETSLDLEAFFKAGMSYQSKQQCADADLSES
ncbi:hypothetical protein GCM10028803_04910 [Larkinella knui]|uniref:Uncharacterized protein n=1 Tax=Larkinella knui TaxID=2025310 RepID=A0A3P1CKI0_9BACT|nr:hypothetical protein [Larkinella knui]RRB13831.1 hypothetical protein EHT87_16360 [Larkinella knui]